MDEKKLTALLEERLGVGEWWTAGYLIEIPDADIERFAKERAEAIVKAIAEKFYVDAKRLFICADCGVITTENPIPCTTCTGDA